MAERIHALRDKEVQAIAYLQLFKLSNAILTYAGPLVVAFALFATYLRLGCTLTVP